ncbi:hypothetical protein D6745_05680 [Candidatus Woesearchaeota archaeon]|nr:MAG: hypothetical protein D6745_05680 [Candidatus Woesearchaeota archaeon]
MAEIDIVIKPIHIERVIYSIVIIMLLVLLIMQLTKDKECPKPEPCVNAAPQIVTKESNRTVETGNESLPKATCVDGIKNQGEEGIDCGGPCPACPSCDNGIKDQNETGIDCGGVCGGYWYDDECHEKPKLSGEIEVIMGDPKIFVDTNEEQFLLQGINLTIINGLNETARLNANLTIWDSSTSTFIRDEVYGVFSIPAIASGENYSGVFEVANEKFKIVGSAGSRPFIDMSGEKTIKINIYNSKGENIKNVSGVYDMHDYD